VKTARSHTGHRVTIHGEDQLLASEQGVSVRLGVRVRKNDLGSHPTQRAAFPKAFVDVLDGDLIHEGNGRDQAVVPQSSGSQIPRPKGNVFLSAR
jgi:hypothetical protein